MEIDFHDPAVAARSSIALELAKYLDSFAAPAVSLASIVQHRFRGPTAAPLGEAERDMLRACELVAGATAPLGAEFIPWSLIGAARTRSMSTVSGSAGGYLTPTELGSLHDALRGDSAIVAAGAQVFDRLGADRSIPRLSGKSSLQWIAEGQPASDSDLALGAISATPRQAIVLTSISEQLLRTPSVESQLRAALRRDIGEGFDAAAVAGAGGVQPLGITNTPGVGAASGTSLSYAGLWAQVEVLLAAGARQRDLFAVAGATAGRILATRKRDTDTGNGFILDAGKLGGIIPCTVTSQVPASTLVLGAANQLGVASWGPGPMLAVDRSTGFNTASARIRVLLLCDVAVLNPAAFVVFGAVT